MTYFISSFDPISQKELDYIKDYRKKNHLRKVFLVVKDDGILDKKDRIKILKKAMKPYRYMQIAQQAKEGIALDESDEKLIRQGYLKYCANGIVNEILRNGYYFEEIIAYHCKKTRKDHAMRVAALAKDLAKRHGLNEIVAYQMGILHDITKDKEDAFHERILQKEDKERLKENKNIWHSYSASYWLKKNMYIHDKRILNAIYYHTVGNPKGKYNQLLFIADKIEPGRKYDVSKETELAKKDLKKGYWLVYEEAKEYIYETEGIHV